MNSQGVKTAAFLFQEDLNDFLRPSQRGRVITISFRERQTVKHLIEALGVPAGTIGTLGAGRVGRIVEGERTTPDVLSVHALLGRLRADGAQAVAMEVSSHALDQGRVDGVRFEVAVFTNLTRDHLDYHGTMEAYGEAKARLFAMPGLKAAVFNIDDAFGARLAALGHTVTVQGLTYRFTYRS